MIWNTNALLLNACVTVINSSVKSNHGMSITCLMIASFVCLAGIPLLANLCSRIQAIVTGDHRAVTVYHH